MTTTNEQQVRLKLIRIAKKGGYTIGKLYMDDVFFCDTLEDKDRGLTSEMTTEEIAKIKVKHETAIPTGTYNVIVNVSPRFKRELPRLLNIKGFDGILIHRGNTAKDTSGCILVGENKEVGKVINSTEYELRLVKLLKKYEHISIEVKS